MAADREAERSACEAEPPDERGAVVPEPSKVSGTAPLDTDAGVVEQDHGRVAASPSVTAGSQ